MTIIQFPLERSPGHKARRLMAQVDELLEGMRIDLAIDHLGAVARLRRQTRPLDTSFRRDLQGRSQ